MPFVTLNQGDAPQELALGDSGVPITNLGPGVVSYGDSENGAFVPQGTLSSGATVTLSGTAYLRANLPRTLISYPPPPRAGVTQAALDLVESGRGVRPFVANGTAYPQWTAVTNGVLTYRVLVANYVSGASIAVDVAAGKLALVPGGAAVPLVITAGNLGAAYTLATAGSSSTELEGTLDQAAPNITITGLIAGAKVRMLLSGTVDRALTITVGSSSQTFTVSPRTGAPVTVDVDTPDGTTVYVTLPGSTGPPGADQTAVVLGNTQTVSYTLVLADLGKAVEMNAAGATTVTVPPNSTAAFAVGSVIEVLRYGAGTVALVAGAGVTIRSRASLLAIADQYTTVALRKRATDEWVLIGNLV